jgi:hypothetical protein
VGVTLPVLNVHFLYFVPQRIDLVQECGGCSHLVFCFIDLIDLFGFSELRGPTPRKRCRTRGAHLGEGRTRMRGESHFRVMNSSARQETAMGSNDLLFKNFDHLKKPLLLPD